MTENDATPLRLNPNLQQVPYSATLACNELCTRMPCKERDVSRLCFGLSPFPIPREVSRELQAHAARNEYLPVRGLPELRAAVADHFARTQAPSRGPEDVLIGPGSKQLIFLLLLVWQGDLLVPTPAWVSYPLQMRILGRRPAFLPTFAPDRWLLQAELLDRYCTAHPAEARLVILTSPSNPAGTAYEPAEVEALATVARRHRLVILADELYGQLHHQGRHTSLARHYPEGTIVSDSLSKWCGAGGWRLGTLLFPPELRSLLDAVATVAAETHTSASAPIQFAAVRAFVGGVEMEDYLRQSRRILRALGARVATILERAGASVAAPAGAYYLFPDFGPLREKLTARGIKTSAAIRDALVNEVQVAVLPGSDFYLDAAELTARISYVDFDGARALSAAADGTDAPLGPDFLDAYCPRILRGVERIADWMSV